jgi:hypothetical protein
MAAELVTGTDPFARKYRREEFKLKLADWQIDAILENDALQER